MRVHKNILMLQEVARGLAELRASVVFVGGATTALYINDRGAPPPTPSDDVDFVVEIASMLEFESLEKRLSQLGFMPPTGEENPPICRKIYKNITVDILPTASGILGFSNPWYSEALSRKEEFSLPDRSKIFIFSMSYFLATKLSAYDSRGKADPRWSQDLEDIIAVLDGNTKAPTLLKTGSPKAVAYLKQSFGELISDVTLFEEIAESFLPYTTERSGRVKRLVQILKNFIA